MQNGNFRGWLLAGLVATVGYAQAGIHLPVPYMAQPDNQTCLPTSFMMALNFMGRIDEFSSATVQNLHKYCQYNRFNAPAIARDYGLYALPNWHNLGWTKETVKHELDMGRPVILGVNQGRSGHFILAVGYTDDDKVIVHDPSGLGGSYGVGGPDQVCEWKDILWRGGIILRPEPFPEPPPLSGVAVGADGGPLERSVDLRLTETEDAEVSFTLVNNGRQRWPSPLFLSPVDPDSSPTKALSSSLAHSTWISPLRVTEAGSGLEAGTTAVVTFKVTAPRTAQTTTALQYFNLHDSDGNWFGNHWLAGPGHRNMAVRAIILPAKRPEWKLPLVETLEGGKARLPWKVKFGQLELADKGTTPTPEGAAIGKLATSGRYFDAAWVGDPDWTDYRMEAWVYCDLKTEQRALGWGRAGIFARDNGQHAVDTKTEVEIGHALVMAFDSDDGGIRAGNSQNGTIGDYRNKRFKLTESGWHHFAISCKGQLVSYELDGKPFHTEDNVPRYRTGECGVYYNSAFDPSVPEEQRNKGILFSGFKVTEPTAQ